MGKAGVFLLLFLLLLLLARGEIRSGIVDEQKTNGLYLRGINTLLGSVPRR